MAEVSIKNMCLRAKWTLPQAADNVILKAVIQTFKLVSRPSQHY